MEGVMKETWKDELIRSLSVTADAVEAMRDMTEVDQFGPIIRLLLETCGSVVVTGAGTSGIAARKLVHTLRCQDISSFYLAPSDALHGASGAIRESDSLIAVSNGGETKEVNAVVQIARNAGAKTVAVTADARSELAMLSDHLLQIVVEKESDTSNLLATASINCVIAAFDAIGCVIMQEREFSLRRFAQTHPAGRVGRVLNDQDKEL